jgi:hypothetical protein
MTTIILLLTKLAVLSLFIFLAGLILIVATDKDDGIPFKMFIGGALGALSCGVILFAILIFS